MREEMKEIKGIYLIFKRWIDLSFKTKIKVKASPTAVL